MNTAQLNAISILNFIDKVDFFFIFSTTSDGILSVLNNELFFFIRAPSSWACGTSLPFSWVFRSLCNSSRNWLP